jgi:hypothetical protein
VIAKQIKIVRRGVYASCLVDLDNVNTFINVTFKDSVIRYRGGAVNAQDVRFVNCRFVLELQNIKSPATYKPPALLTALLNSADQKHIHLQ